MFAGRINIKKIINSHPISFRNRGITNPFAAAISMHPVRKIIAFLKGINSGNIKAIPSGYKK